MRSRGFTLIELMVSMALFGLIASGAMALVMSAARSQAHSARVDVAQGALRTGIDFITRDALMASAGVSGGRITLPGGAVVNAVDFVNGNGVGPNGADQLDLYLVDGTATAQLSAAAAANATTLSITYEQSSGTFSFSTTPIQSWVQVSDVALQTAAVTTLTNVSGTTLTIGALPSSFAANSYVMASRHVTYSVSNTQFGVSNASLQNATMLMMALNGAAAQPLAEGVEDLQVAYGFDNDGDGAVTEVGAAAGDDEWLYNVAGETAGTWSIANLRTIRVTLVAKGTSADSGNAVFPVEPKAEDHAAGTTSDGFIRRVLRTEIAVRNFNL